MSDKLTQKSSATLLKISVKFGGLLCDSIIKLTNLVLSALRREVKLFLGLLPTWQVDKLPLFYPLRLSEHEEAASSCSSGMKDND